MEITSIFDIGANVGAFALANKQCKIVAVEASPYTFLRLQSNVQGTDITPLHYAVSNSENETVDFYHCKSADVLSTMDLRWLTSNESRFGHCGNDVEKLSVKTISLDKLVQLYGKPDLIKIDVEGAEHLVLASLSQKVPYICFEWAAEWESEIIQAIDRLVTIGFTMFHIQNLDVYTYRPPTFELTADDLKKTISQKRKRVDWGMIWAK